MGVMTVMITVTGSANWRGVQHVGGSDPYTPWSWASDIADNFILSDKGSFIAGSKDHVVALLESYEERRSQPHVSYQNKRGNSRLF